MASMISASKHEDITPMDNAIRIVNRMLKKRKEKYGEDYISGFNSGKMKHLFDIGEDNLYKNNIQESSASLCDNKDYMAFFQNYDIFIKVDGQSGAIVYDSDTDEYVLLTRYDDKKNKFKNGTNISKGYYKLMKGNADTYSKGKNTHHYYLEVWPRPSDDEKGKHAKIVRELYGRIDKMENRKERLSSYEFNSCEFVGYKFQNTPGVFGNNIALHKEQNIDAKYAKENLLMIHMFSKFEETLKSEGNTIYDSFKECLLDPNNMIEGFILERNIDIICDVHYIKVRQNVFTKKGIYEKMKKEWGKMLKSKNIEAMKNISENIICPNLISE